MSDALEEVLRAYLEKDGDVVIYTAALMDLERLQRLAAQPAQGERAEIERLRSLLWVNVFCGGCGNRYRYNRADDSDGELEAQKHRESYPDCQSNQVLWPKA